MYLPPNPDYYHDLPKVLANLPEQMLTTEESHHLQARAMSSQNRPMHFRVLNWIGKQLVLWGNTLIHYYSRLGADPCEHANQPV